MIEAPSSDSGLILPAWWSNFRDGQLEIITEVAEALVTHPVVILDAPTGTGKTLIAEAARQLLEAKKTLYLATTIGLQQQFVTDYPYARLIMGRSNYPTADHPEAFPMISAEDCDKHSIGESELECSRCTPWFTCPYERAKRKALGGPLAVANTAYFLREANYAGRFSKRDLIIIDEADRLETELLSFIEIVISQRRLEKLGIGRPSRITVPAAWQSWVKEEATPALQDALDSLPKTSEIKVSRERRALERLQTQLDGINLEDGNWVFAPMGDDDVRFKPVRVSHDAPALVFTHAKHYLLMSATVISPDHMAASLGVKDYAYIPAPSSFNPRRRPILVRPVADMSNKVRQWEECADELQRILEQHPDERILVHTVSFRLCAFLAESLRSPRVLTYTKAAERDITLNRFIKTHAAVLLAPSLDRGVDLPHDACRVVVVAKIPFPDLSDRQVSALLHSKGGDLDYAVRTVRTLVQMTGRGMRAADDWCISYILDRQFISNIWRRSKQLLPVWWRDAIQWHAKSATIELEGSTQNAEANTNA